MIYLYITICIFLAFVVFQTLYILIPLFKNEKKQKIKISKRYSFSIIVPAFNEEKVLEHCISGFQQLKYKKAELIIVNDGSTDATMDLLTVLLDLRLYHRSIDNRLPHQDIIGVFRSNKYSNIYVLDKLNGGKADSLNTGINFSKNEITITLDADSVLESHSLCEMNACFQNEKVIACGGNVLIAQAFNGDFNNLKPTFKVNGVIRYQFLQYLTAFYLHKRTQASLGAITVIAGAFGAFRKDVLYKIDGFRKTIGEDMDITIKLHKWIKENEQKEKISFAPSAICYTECPSTFQNMFKQRVRWQKAFIDCLIYYRASFFRKLSIRFSIFFLVDQFIIGTLNAFPVVATPIILILHDGHMILFLILGIGAIFLFMYQSITTIFISYLHGIKLSKKDMIRVILFLPLEIFVYRMINLTFVVYGTLSYFRNSQSWQKTDRSGDISWQRVPGA